MLRKLFSSLFAIVLCLSVTSSAFAESSQPKEVSVNLFQKYSTELQVTEEEPYKEVYVPERGTILFNSITLDKNVPSDDSRVSLFQIPDEKYSITSSQGEKNIFGVVLFQLDYTTTWTFDYNTVKSSSSYVTITNGFAWTFKGSSSNGPTISDNDKEHEWTGTANFGITVGGMDVSNNTLINQHRVRHNGTYAWKYDFL